MAMGITLTEIPHKFGKNPESFSMRSSRKNAVEDIFDGYSEDLPILLPREHGDETDATTVEQPDQYSNNTELTEVSEKPYDTTTEKSTSGDFYNLTAKESDGMILHFEQLKGKYVLITNIAASCTREWQMEFLEEIHNNYSEDLVVIGFPSNSFLQNWKTAEETKKCFITRYDCSFKIMEKVKVNGWGAHKVFKYLKDRKVGTWGLKAIKWNFEKFLINREGEIVKRYPTYKHPNLVKQDMDKFLADEKKIEKGVPRKKKSSKKLTDKDGNTDGSKIQRVIYI